MYTWKPRAAEMVAKNANEESLFLLHFTAFMTSFCHSSLDIESEVSIVITQVQQNYRKPSS